MKPSMSDSLEKLVDKIPDVYFDWYARLIPGAFVLLLLRFEQGGPFTFQPSGERLFLFAGIAYLLGHILQPAASFIARRFRDDATEKLYAKAKADPTKKSETEKVSKTHAESVSMFSISIATLAIWTVNLQEVHWKFCASSCHLLILAVVFFAFGTERVYTRRDKIEKIE